MEEPCFFMDLFPGNQYRHQTKDDGKQQEKVTQPVHREVNADTQCGDPVYLIIDPPVIKTYCCIAVPDPDQKDEINGKGNQ
jgi:hypothetical protein